MAEIDAEIEHLEEGQHHAAPRHEEVFSQVQQQQQSQHSINEVDIIASLRSSRIASPAKSSPAKMEFSQARHSQQDVIREDIYIQHVAPEVVIEEVRYRSYLKIDEIFSLQNLHN